MAMNEDSLAAGTDTRPPMLEEGDYESGKKRIWRYMKGKDNGHIIIYSILNGLFVLGEITVMVNDAEVTRARTIQDLTPEEKTIYDCDIKAKNSLCQGLPRTNFALLNQT
ncbi:hypothetical protein Tco_1437529 [Tanacetum coccineum]